MEVNMATLQYILKNEVDNNLTIPRNLEQQLKNIDHNSPYAHRGRLVATTFNYCSDYNYSATNRYLHRILTRLYALYCNKPKDIYIQGGYLTYGASDTITKSEYDLSPLPVSYGIRPAFIDITHIGRGKSYFDQKIIEEPPRGERNKSFELQLIQQVNHYVRVYAEHVADVVNVRIFTDIINETFIDKVYNLIPHFLGLPEKYQTMSLDPNARNTLEFKRLEAIINLAKYFYCDYEQHNTDEHVGIINELLEQIDALYAMDYTKLLDQFTQTFSTTRSSYALDQVRRTQSSAKSDIKSYEQYLENAYKRLQDAIILEQGLLNAQPDDIKIFTDNLAKNKHITILNASGTKIELLITAPLKYYEPASLQVLIDNKHSVFYTKLNEQNQKLLKAAIIDGKFQILVQAQVHCCIRNSSTEPLEFTARNDITFDALPNPHLTYYNCWSAARSLLKQCVLKSQYEMIVPQLIAAVQSINMAESATFYQRFLPDFNSKSDTSKIFINPETGETLTKLEALKLLEDVSKPEVEPTDTPKEYTQIEVEDNDEFWED